MSTQTIENSFGRHSSEWHPHPTNEGVFLKHLVTGSDTNNSVSCHLVKIAPNAMIKMHHHSAQLEIHEIIGGDGLCHYKEGVCSYSVGDINILHKNVDHEIIASDKGLYILAKFCPASV